MVALVQATDRFLTDVKALSLLDLGKQWDIEWWEADTRPVPVSSLRPNVLVIQQLVARKELWPVKRGRKVASAAAEVPNAAAADAWDSVSAFATADVPDTEAEAVDTEEEGLGEDSVLNSMQAEAQDLWERVEEVLDEAGLVEVGTGVMDLFGTGAGPIDNPDGTDEADGMEAEASMAAEAQAEALPSLPVGREAPTIPKLPAEAVVVMEGYGRIAFHASKNSFEATCSRAGHGHCTLTRTCKGRFLKATGLVAGRPLGFLGCWLLHGGTCDTKELHSHKAAWAETFTPEARARARAQILALPGGSALASHERRRSSGEAEEPATLHGLL